MSVVVCPHCTHENPVGATICEFCQQELNPETEKVDEATQPIKKAHGGTTPFSDGIYLYIQDSDIPVVITPERLKESPVIIGRTDSTGREFSDVDLTPYLAKEKGVSRRHATLSYGRNGLTITDQGSANFTLLNGKKLFPFQDTLLLNGDIIHLGKLVVLVRFHLPGESTTRPPLDD